MPFDLRSHERAACGVGFVATRKALASHQILELALDALSCVEHRWRLRRRSHHR